MSRVALVLFLLVVAGCSSLPTPKPNGAMLEAKSRSGSYSSFVSESGRYVKAGNVSAFEGYFQGGEMIDEQTFFEIAGDTEAAAEVASARTGDRVGLIASSLGTAASIALGIIGISMVVSNPTLPPGPDMNEGVVPEAQHIGRYITAPAFVGVLAFGAWAFYQWFKLSPPRYVFVEQGYSKRGYDAATKYNRSLNGESEPDRRDDSSARPRSDVPMRLSLVPRLP